MTLIQVSEIMMVLGVLTLLGLIAFAIYQVGKIAGKEEAHREK